MTYKNSLPHTDPWFGVIWRGDNSSIHIPTPFLQHVTESDHRYFLQSFVHEKIYITFFKKKESKSLTSPVSSSQYVASHNNYIHSVRLFLDLYDMYADVFTINDTVVLVSLSGISFILLLLLLHEILRRLNFLHKAISIIV